MTNKIIPKGKDWLEFIQSQEVKEFREKELFNERKKEIIKFLKTGLIINKEVFMEFYNITDEDLK